MTTTTLTKTPRTLIAAATSNAAGSTTRGTAGEYSATVPAGIFKASI